MNYYMRNKNWCKISTKMISNWFTKLHSIVRNKWLPNSPAALISILSTPEPILTIIRKALNFSRSSLVRVMVCHMRAPTASFSTFSCISWVDCASQKATVATSLRIGISTEQSRPSRSATNGRACNGPFAIGPLRAPTYGLQKYKYIIY